ncbi:MAG: aminopeptidase P family protein [Candidatus Marinimicrobia bacterium]|jgi:Xaa-Pro aminopeptidase|nr:aminopeptidase P family protein [Candidatus Neomarinimicrobiota bacterium]MDP7094945.1 aminopeptidase P family protein [Candidatus Neomarinimicrobiota bacterium]
MSEQIFTQRQNNLKNKLAEMGVDGILLTNLTSIRYLCGFSGSAASCLITTDGSYFISDGRYDVQSKNQVKGLERFIDFGTHLSIIEKNNLIQNGLKLGFEGDHTSVSQFKAMQDIFSNVNWESTSMLMENLQAIKDQSELDAIRTAVEITDAIYEEIIPMLKVGTTEKDVAIQLVTRYRQESDGEAYSPIVAGGPNSALPHAVPGDRPFEKGDFIVIDAAAKFSGYHADMTRTPVVGEATDKHREIYNTVKDAQQAGCDTAKAGMTCKEVDNVTRDYITEKGYGEYFNHGTGHGLGLEIHTEPRMSQLSTQTLETNNVVTIEPGIYLEGWGGVRIEDDVIIHEEGCEVLNKTTKELVVLT